MALADILYSHLACVCFSVCACTLWDCKFHWEVEAARSPSYLLLSAARQVAVAASVTTGITGFPVMNCACDTVILYRTRHLAPSHLA